MIESRPDWTISRQRVGGVPITAFRCKNGTARKWDDPRIFDFVADIYEERRRRRLVRPRRKRIFAPGVVCSHPQCGVNGVRETVRHPDVWFDWGVSHESLGGKGSCVGLLPTCILKATTVFAVGFNSSLMTAVQTSWSGPVSQLSSHTG